MDNYFLGIDIGSSYTKYVVIDPDNNINYSKILKTISRNNDEKVETREYINNNFPISFSCATGYGRELAKDCNITKTEIYCASAGVSALFEEEKTIVDVGGEDVKVIKSGNNGRVLDFYMNTKCAAGTGTFITEIAERAEIDLSKMSEMASRSNFAKELNSFCTVFAKTEIMKWLFDDVPVEDVAKGIYISIVNRISKIRMDKNLPIYLIGGVSEYHPYLRNVMEEKFNSKVTVPENPQIIIAFGAAILAKKHNGKLVKQ
jgi:predicted CoA-substrate-specific enzyme activase